MKIPRRARLLQAPKQGGLGGVGVLGLRDRPGGARGEEGGEEGGGER